MKAMQTGQADARRAAGSNGNGHRPVAELDELRATCKRQALVLDKLYTAVSALHSGAAALKAENAELRVAVARMPSQAARSAPAANGGAPRDHDLEISVPLDQHAPRAARKAVADHLRRHVSAAVLDDAKLIVSELVTNSVCHSGASAGATATIRVELTPTAVCLEVADAGRAGLIAPRDADLNAGHGFGLSLVQTLSRRWGVERVADSGTRVWAELQHAPRATASLAS
jgi:anti-sigma regulatory factor (Ser/Thr protein kinase)